MDCPQQGRQARNQGRQRAGDVQMRLYRVLAGASPRRTEGSFLRTWHLLFTHPLACHVVWRRRLHGIACKHLTFSRHMIGISMYPAVGDRVCAKILDCGSEVCCLLRDCTCLSSSFPSLVANRHVTPWWLNAASPPISCAAPGGPDPRPSLAATSSLTRTRNSDT